MVEIQEVKKKICLIGDWGVGKTSLIRKYVFNQFDDKYLVTFGTKISKKRIKYKLQEDRMIDLNLLIWDIMGQKEFKKVQLNAYKSANGAFIVCDVTRRESLNNILNWHSDLLSITGDIPVVILANKHDLLNQGEFTNKDVEDLANNLNAKYFFTSAKTGFNVEDAFKEIGKRLLD